MKGRTCWKCGAEEFGDPVPACDESDYTWTKVHVWNDPNDPSFSWTKSMAKSTVQCSLCGAEVTGQLEHVKWHRRMAELESYVESLKEEPRHDEIL